MVRTDRANVAGRPCHVVGTASVALAFRRNSRADAVNGRYWLARVGRIDQVGRPKRLADGPGGHAPTPWLPQLAADIRLKADQIAGACASLGAGASS